MKARIALASIAMALVGMLAAGQQPAHAVSKDVKRKCKGDYKRLCPSYRVGSDELRACMRTQHRAISNACMNALVDSGEAPASVRRR